MAHERIGDRADHPHRAVAEAPVQLLLQEHHVGRSVGAGLVVHAVVRHDANHRAEAHQLADALVHRAIEGVGLGRARRVRMLHEVGQRQIEQPSPRPAPAA